MTVACDVPKSFPVPPVHTGDAIGTAPAQPLMIICVGEVEYTEDDPALGTWWQQQTLTVGRCASVTEAITFASIAVEREEFPFDDYEAFGFSPRLFVKPSRANCLASLAIPTGKSNLPPVRTGHRQRPVCRHQLSVCDALPISAPPISLRVWRFGWKWNACGRPMAAAPEECLRSGASGRGFLSGCQICHPIVRHISMLSIR
ncbi:hypothetical protein D2T31_21485 [Sinirhodobacter populi]|uniref:Uncharacterized protein n=1 Tax=Paenirhodobacter populi TaxID=2306993 RepID=A0A443JZF6_9RHOB|nr:hypothetical protein [Sinirhodobacter populi]RWR25898.1 hypothetical protein D2T31_21485 [Sinirhodobacter populi]